MPGFDLSAYQGIFPAAMTFFDAEGNLDLSSTLDHWRWLEQQGAQGLVVAGTSGEFAALTIEERLQLFRLAVQHFAGRLPIVAGTGHTATRLTIEISRAAQEIGADALIVLLPYFSRPPIPAVLDHFRAVRAATDRPIMLYNNPSNTACTALSPPQIAGLVEHDTVHMVKSTMESVVPIHDLSLLVGDSMRIFYGSFLSAYEALAAGAHGWVSGVLNVTCPIAGEMDRAVRVDGNLAAGRALWKRMLPLVHLYTYQQLGAVADIPIYRGILQLWGRHGGHSRLPFASLTDDQLRILAERLRQSGWLSS